MRTGERFAAIVNQRCRDPSEGMNVQGSSTMVMLVGIQSRHDSGRPMKALTTFVFSQDCAKKERLRLILKRFPRKVTIAFRLES